MSLSRAGVQVSLGIATLMSGVPVPLAATHQAGSLLLLTFALWLGHALRAGPVQAAATSASRVAALAAARVATAAAKKL